GESLRPRRRREGDGAALRHHGQSGEVARLAVRDDDGLDEPAECARRFPGGSLALPGIAPEEDGDSCADADPECLEGVIVLGAGANGGHAGLPGWSWLRNRRSVASRTPRATAATTAGTSPAIASMTARSSRDGTSRTPRA